MESVGLHLDNKHVLSEEEGVTETRGGGLSCNSVDENWGNGRPFLT